HARKGIHFEHRHRRRRLAHPGARCAARGGGRDRNVEDEAVRHPAAFDAESLERLQQRQVEGVRVDVVDGQLVAPPPQQVGRPAQTYQSAAPTFGTKCISPRAHASRRSWYSPLRMAGAPTIKKPDAANSTPAKSHVPRSRTGCRPRLRWDSTKP